MDALLQSPLPPTSLFGPSIFFFPFALSNLMTSFSHIEPTDGGAGFEYFFFHIECLYVSLSRKPPGIIITLSVRVFSSGPALLMFPKRRSQFPRSRVLSLRFQCKHCSHPFYNLWTCISCPVLFQRLRQIFSDFSVLCSRMVVGRPVFSRFMRP